MGEGGFGGRGWLQRARGVDPGFELRSFGARDLGVRSFDVENFELRAFDAWVGGGAQAEASA